jgi:mycothiol synthase
VIDLRTPTLDDIPELTEFFARLEESGGRGESEDEIRHLLTTPLFDVEADFRIAFEDGQIVGWCDVWDQNKAHERLFLDPRASRDAFRVYETLFDWGLERCRAVAADGAVCRAAGTSEDEAFAGEVKKRGFNLIRHFFRMEIDLEEAPEEPAWPEGISLRTFRSGEERAVYDAICDAFADHWDFVPTAFDEWEQFMVQAPTFDASLWFIA